MPDKQRQLSHRGLVENLNLQDKTALKGVINSESILLDLLVKTLKIEVENIQIERLSKKQFTAGAWAFLQAELNGEENFARTMINLLELKDID